MIVHHGRVIVVGSFLHAIDLDLHLRRNWHQRKDFERFARFAYLRRHPYFLLIKSVLQVEAMIEGIDLVRMKEPYNPPPIIIMLYVAISDTALTLSEPHQTLAKYCLPLVFLNLVYLLDRRRDALQNTIRYREPTPRISCQRQNRDRGKTYTHS